MKGVKLGLRGAPNGVEGQFPSHCRPPRAYVGEPETFEDTLCRLFFERIILKEVAHFVGTTARSDWRTRQVGYKMMFRPPRRHPTEQSNRFFLDLSLFPTPF
jgi:hypothetical protein